MEENNPQEDVPQEDKPQEKETRDVVGSSEGPNLRTHITCMLGKIKRIWRCFRKCFCRFWLWFNKQVVPAGLLVALITILATSYLTRRSEQDVLNRATKQRLYHAGFEATMNSEAAEKIKEEIDNKGDVKHVRVNVRRLGSAAAAVVLQDANLLSILSGEQVILLWSYVNVIRLLNESLQIYQQTLSSQDFENTEPVNKMRELVLENAETICAMVSLLEEKVPQCFDDKLYDLQIINEMKQRLNDITAEHAKREVIRESKEE